MEDKMNCKKESMYINKFEWTSCNQHGDRYKIVKSELKDQIAFFKNLRIW